MIRAYDDVPKILCYPGELNQVFLTLLTNAAEAIEGEGTIRIHAGQEEDSVYVRIADDGIGIPAERLERLFEFDFTATDSRIKMGAGLVIAAQHHPQAPRRHRRAKPGGSWQHFCHSSPQDSVGSVTAGLSPRPPKTRALPRERTSNWRNYWRSCGLPRPSSFTRRKWPPSENWWWESFMS